MFYIFSPQTKLTATSALLSSRFLHFPSSPALARGGNLSQALEARSPPRRATPRQCKSPSVSRAAVAAWGLAVGLEVCLTLDTVLQELLDPRKENRAQRPFTEHGGSVHCPHPPHPGSGYLAKSPSYCVWRRKNLSSFLPKPPLVLRGAASRKAGSHVNFLEPILELK